MSSLLPGYEYDIFVSYRQKDNLPTPGFGRQANDGWVTEFVANLKKELEATFKEDISIYFDENPHDGLLQTHHVNKSLEGKLKCLVLIPILSRTYCDPASFAWQNEFLAFRDLAKTDQFGLDIRLANRNVASRILPVQIHDLNTEDQKLFEKEIGGALRSITFIFKSQGVNRALTADDSRNDNANRTLYRDQINKTANAVEEVIGALRHTSPLSSTPEVRLEESVQMPAHGTKWFWSELVRRNVFRAGLAYGIAALAARQVASILTNVFELKDQIPNILTWVLVGIFPFAMVLAWLYERSPQGLIRTTSPQAAENPYKDSQKKPLTGGFIIALLGALVIILFVYIYFIQSNATAPLTKSEKSIAVLPFENRSENARDEYLAEGLTDEIINRLAILGDLSVYRGKGLNPETIAKDLGVITVLTGSVQRSGDTVRINAQLMEGKKYIWGTTFNRNNRDVMALQTDIAKRIAEVLKVKINEVEKARLEHRPTENATAYDYYLKGRKLYYWYKKDSNRQAIEQFKKALAMDPGYAHAWAGLGDAYSQLHNRFGMDVSWLDSSLTAGTKAIRLDSTLSDGYKALANAHNYARRYDKAISLLKKSLELDPNNTAAVGNLGTNYMLLGDLPEALRWEKKAAGLNPKNAIPFFITGWIYRWMGDLDQAEIWLKRSLVLNPMSIWDAYEHLAYCLVSQGRNEEALQLIPTVVALDPNDARILEIAGLIANFAGDKVQAKKYFQQSIDSNESFRNDPVTVSPIGLGQILLEEGNRVDAEIYLSRTLEINLNEIRKGSLDDDPPFYIAGIYAIRGQREESLTWLKKAIDSKWIDYEQIVHGPWFIKYQNDPDFLVQVEFLRKKTEAMRQQAAKF